MPPGTAPSAHLGRVNSDFFCRPSCRRRPQLPASMRHLPQSLRRNPACPRRRRCRPRQRLCRLSGCAPRPRPLCGSLEPRALHARAGHLRRLARRGAAHPPGARPLHAAWPPSLSSVRRLLSSWVLFPRSPRTASAAGGAGSSPQGRGPRRRSRALPSRTVAPSLAEARARAPDFLSLPPPSLADASTASDAHCLSPSCDPIPPRLRAAVLIAGASPSLFSLTLAACSADPASPAALDASAAFAPPGAGGALSVSGGSPTLTDVDFWRAPAAATPA